MSRAEPDIWRNVVGYGSKYQVSYSARVRRVYPSGKTREMSAYKKTGVKHKKIHRDRLFVKLTDDFGKAKEVPLLKIVSEAFFPPPKDGFVPYHLNGVVTDNWVSNIGFISRSELGKRTGHISKAQPVAKIDRTGEIVDTFRSARDAAKACFMSYQTIIDRCNGGYSRGGKSHTFKSVFAPDGFAYSWDEDKKIIATQKRIAKELAGHNIVVCLYGYNETYYNDTPMQNAEWQEVIGGGNGGNNNEK